MATSARSFSLGQRVLATGKPGTLRFIGPTEFATGEWYGVELDEDSGKNNGSVQDKEYFCCAEKHGLFVRKTQIRPEIARASRNSSRLASLRAKRNAALKKREEVVSATGSPSGPAPVAEDDAKAAPAARSLEAAAQPAAAAASPAAASPAGATPTAEPLESDAGGVPRATPLKVASPAMAAPVATAPVATAPVATAPVATALEATAPVTPAPAASRVPVSRTPPALDPVAADATSAQGSTSPAPLSTPRESLTTPRESPTTPASASSRGTPAEAREWQRRLAASDRELRAAKAEGEQATRRFQALERRLEREKLRGDKLQGQCDESTAALQEAQKELRSAKSPLRRVSETAAAAAGRVPELEAQIIAHETRERDALAAQEAAGAEKAALAEEVEGLRAEREAWASEKSALEAELETSRGTLRSAEGTLRALQGGREDADVRESELRQGLGKERAQAATLVRRLEEANTEVGRLQEELEALILEKEEAGLEKEELEEKCLDLELKLEEVSLSGSEAEAELKSLKEALAASGGSGDMQKLLEQNQKLRDALVRARALAQTEKADAVKALKEAEKRAATAEVAATGKEELEAKSKEMKEEMEELLERVDTAGAYEDMLEDLSSRNAAFSEEKNELKVHVEDLEAALEVAEEMEETQTEEIQSLARDLAHAEANLSIEVEAAETLRKQLGQLQTQMKRQLSLTVSRDGPLESVILPEGSDEAIEQKLQEVEAGARLERERLFGVLGSGTHRWAEAAQLSLRLQRLECVVPEVVLSGLEDQLGAEGAAVEAGILASGGLEMLLRSEGMHPEMGGDPGARDFVGWDEDKGARELAKAGLRKRQGARNRLAGVLAGAGAMASGVLAYLTGAAGSRADPVEAAAALRRPLERLATELGGAVEALARSASPPDTVNGLASSLETALAGLREALRVAPDASDLITVDKMLFRSAAKAADLPPPSPAMLVTAAPGLLVNAVMAAGASREAWAARGTPVSPRTSASPRAPAAPAAAAAEALWDGVVGVYRAAASGALALGSEAGLRELADGLVAATIAAEGLLAADLAASGSLAEGEDPIAPEVVPEAEAAVQRLLGLPLNDDEASTEVHRIHALASLHPDPLAEARVENERARTLAHLEVGHEVAPELEAKRKALVEAAAAGVLLAELRSEKGTAETALTDTRKALAAAERRREVLEGESARLRGALEVKGKSLEELGEKLSRTEATKMQLEERLVRDTAELEEEIRELEKRVKGKGRGSSGGRRPEATPPPDTGDHRDFFARMLGSPAAASPAPPASAQKSGPPLPRRYVSAPDGGAIAGAAGSDGGLGGPEELERLRSAVRQSQRAARKWQGVATRVLVGPALLPLPEMKARRVIGVPGKQYGRTRVVSLQPRGGLRGGGTSA